MSIITSHHCFFKGNVIVEAQRKGEKMISKILSDPIYAPSYEFQKQHDAYMELMEKCKETFMKDDIYVSIDDTELPLHQNNKVILDIIQTTLEFTRLLCMADSLCQDRYIRIRTRNLQNKIFIKIQYSNPSILDSKFDSLEKNIARKVEYACGYFKHHIENESGMIKIALPFPK